MKLLTKASAIGVNRFFFLDSPTAVTEVLLMLVHWMFLREALRKERTVDHVLYLLGNHTEPEPANEKPGSSPR